MKDFIEKGYLNLDDPELNQGAIDLSTFSPIHKLKLASFTHEMQENKL